MCIKPTNLYVIYKIYHIRHNTMKKIYKWTDKKQTQRLWGQWHKKTTKHTPHNQTQGLMFKCCIILGNKIVFLLYFFNNRWSTNQRIWIARLSTHYSISIGNLPFPSIRFRPFQVVPIMISLDRRRNHRNVNPNLPKIEVLQSITLIDHLELNINRSPNKKYN